MILPKSAWNVITRCTWEKLAMLFGSIMITLKTGDVDGSHSPVNFLKERAREGQGGIKACGSSMF